MKKIIFSFLILILLLPVFAHSRMTPPVYVFQSSNCSFLTWYGALCHDTDDGKLYKWNGTALEEIATLNNGQLLLPDGSGAAPSLTFTSDPDTGIYRHGANEIGFRTGAGSSMRFDGTHLQLDSGTSIFNVGTGVHLRSSGVSYFAGGNVGIGTTNPAYLLHLSSSGDTDLAINAPSTTSSGAIRYMSGGAQKWKVGRGSSVGSDDFEFYEIRRRS